MNDLPIALNKKDGATETSSGSAVEHLGNEAGITPAPVVSQPSENHDTSSRHPSLERLRTYEQDIASLVKNQKTSLVSIAVAENKRRVAEGVTTPEPPPTTYKIWFVAGTSIVILLLALTGVFFVLTKKGSQTETAATVPAVLRTERTLEVREATLESIRSTLAKEKTQEWPYGTLTAITPTTADSLLKASDLLTVIGEHIPSTLLRSFEEEFAVGVHAVGDGEVFLILKPRDYESAFAGMLMWETYLEEDISLLFGSTRKETSTSTSVTLYEPWTDVLIKNNDARLLRTRDGKTRLLYSFPSKNHLIITTSEETLKEIFTRIIGNQFVPR